ncbi:hypothetical protein COOONC_22380 [Cooperia oncophora]
MTFLRFFLLLSSSALIVWGDRNVDSNDLLKQMFGITRDESKSMEDLQQRFVDDHGNINKAYFQGISIDGVKLIREVTSWDSPQIALEAVRSLTKTAVYLLLK